MAPNSRCTNVPSLLRKLKRQTRANVAVVFALAVVPIAGFVGAAVDYSQASSVKAAMQAAADATALMLSKNLSTNPLLARQASQKASEYFGGVFNRPAASALQVSATYANAGQSSVTVNANATVKAAFMKLAGISTMNVAVTSTATWGGSAKMQVALALDNTGSMLWSGKMASLKTATHALLDQLKASAAQSNDVNVAIIPFAREVNVGGAANYNAPWIDWSDWDDDNGSDTETKKCTSTSTGKNGKTKKKCTTSTTWVPDNHNTWNGCIADRDQSYDVTNTAPKPGDKDLPPSTASTLFPAVQSDTCPEAILVLTNDWSLLHWKVDRMTPTGTTNQAIGLAWAWHALSQGLPLHAPGKSPDTQQVIILLTDGMNTQNRWYIDQPSIDARQKLLCANIKAAGITLYTIQVNTGGRDPVSTMLKDCASKPEYFFHLTTADAIVTAFTAIGTNMSKLRLSR